MDEVHISLKPQELFMLGPIPITNSMFMMFFVMALVLIVGTLVARKAQIVPNGKSQTLMEMLVGFLLDLVEGSGGKKYGRRIFPLISGIFIFIIFSNLTGVLPGVGTFGVYKDPDHTVDVEHVAESDSAKLASSSESLIAPSAMNADEEHAGKVLVPIMRPPTADLNMTFALSMTAFVAIQIAGVSSLGVRGRIKHMADPPFLFPIEVIGELSRILSLSARLFGNVFAGEILLGVMYSIAAAIKIAILPVFIPVIFIGVEVLFGTIQALVFALLTLIYIILAAAHTDHDSDAEHAHDNQSSPAPTPAASAAGD